jgi:AraC-like DNA-binding protein
MLYIIQVITIFSFFLLSLLIWQYRKKLDASIYIFSFFLFGKGVTLLSNLMLVKSILPEDNLLFSSGLLLNSFLFAYAPFLYFFALSITKGRISIKEHSIHFIPFLLFFIINLSTVLYYNFDRQSDIFQTIIKIQNIYNFGYYAQVIIYTLLSFYTISNADKTNRKFKKVSVWLQRILLLFLMIWFLFLTSALIDRYIDNTSIPTILNGLGVLLLLVLANSTLFMTLSNPEYFYNNVIFKLKKETENTILTKANYDQLCNLILEKKLYKNANLKIGDLSEEMKFSTRNISALISTFYEGNFYDFINFYRIEEAKKLLVDSETQMTILAILYEAGFNSKSVFNSVFKKTVGETPSSYRKYHIAAKYGS